MPPGCPPARGRADRVDISSAAGDQPGDQRVRVPHVTGSELIATPDEGWHLRDEIQHPLGMCRLFGQSKRAFDRVFDIWNSTVLPAPNLVAEEPEAACPAGANGTFGNDASVRAKGVPDRCHLNHERVRRDADLEPRVVQVASRAAARSVRVRPRTRGR